MLFDDAEDERWDNINFVKRVKAQDSKPKFTVDTKVSTKQINESGTRILITTKTRQASRGAKARDLRIKNKQQRIIK